VENEPYERRPRSGYSVNQKNSSWSAFASFRTAGASELHTGEIMLESNKFSFGE
jgi:hypothetical protein